MELWYKDDTASSMCLGKEKRVVALVHQHLGFASVVKVSDLPESQMLKLETVSGHILVDYKLNHVATEESN